MKTVLAFLLALVTSAAVAQGNLEVNTPAISQAKSAMAAASPSPRTGFGSYFSPWPCWWR